MGWETITPPDGSLTLTRYNDLAVLDGRVLAIAASGQILAWSNGTSSVSQVFGHARCLTFAPNEDIGWMGFLVAGGEGFRLMRTADSGKSWSGVDGLPADPQDGLCGIKAVSAEVAFACGTHKKTSPPGVWRTVDGQGWAALDLPPGATNLIDLHFWNRHRGLVAGGSGGDASTPAIWLTDDGGRDWRRAHIEGQLPAGSYCWKLFFLDDDVGFASVANGKGTSTILKTSDGGIRWRAIPVLNVGGNGDLQGIGFVNHRHGWIGQWGGGAFETDDCGESWKAADPALQDVNRIRVTRHAVYASGSALYRLARRHESGDESGGDHA